MNRFVLPLFALAPWLVAQGLHVVPSAHAASDAPSLTGVAGIGITDRQQIVIDAAHLAPLVGRDLTGLVFRREGADPSAFTANTAQVVVLVGGANSSAQDVRPDFAANSTSPLEVFRGAVQVPASPPPTSTPGWSAPDAVELSFSTPFRYSGGPLLIDIHGTVTTESWWPVDAVEDGTAGAVIVEGHACGRLATVHGATALVAERDLVLGESVICTLFGEPAAPAFLLLGLGTLPSPADLAFLGAPGCELRVQPLSALATIVSPPPFDPLFGGLAERVVHLPTDAGLAGAEFVLQWAELLPGTLATSNTLRCRIASTRPNLGLAVVWSRAGTAPIVQFTRVPVVGLRWR
jgi:hypothetical protein